MDQANRSPNQLQHRLTSPFAEPNWALLFVLAAIALALAIRVWMGANIRDDAYITLRYAENLANGQGFTFNPGERGGNPRLLLSLAANLDCIASQTPRADGRYR